MRSGNSRSARGAACALLAALSCREARADVFSLWGAGAAGVAEAGARAARASDGHAAHHNPGGLAFGRGSAAEAGLLLAASRLEAAGQRPGLDQRASLVAAASGGLHWLPTVRFGFLFHTPTTTLLRVRVRGPSEPQFPYYDNRSQRLVAAPAVALRPLPWLGVGASLDALAGLDGSASLQPGPTGASEPRVDQRVTPTLRPTLGVRARLPADFTAALVYRAQFQVSIETRTDATVAGVPIQARVQQDQALFDPETFLAAAAWSPARRLELEADIALHRWSRYRGPALRIESVIPGVRAEPVAADLTYRDTVSARLGASYPLLSGPARLRARAGGGYETSMLDGAAQGVTNQLDGAKVMLAAGATLEVPSLNLTAGLGVQAHLLPERSIPKKACEATPCPADTVAGPDPRDPSAGITDPGYPSLRGGGLVLAGTFSVGARW